MTATVIRLPEEELNLYKVLASEKGLSLAGYFREAARKASGIKTASSKKSVWDLGTKFVIKKGPKTGSIDHDKYLYHQ